jgi:hypothetical protein
MARKSKIDDFTLCIKKYLDSGVFDKRLGKFKGVSGLARTSFRCRRWFRELSFANQVIGYHRVKNTYIAVPAVHNPQTEISMETALTIRPDIQIGQKICVEQLVTKDGFQDLASGGAEPDCQHLPELRHFIRIPERSGCPVFREILPTMCRL